MSAHSGRNKFSLCLSSAWIKNWQNWNKNLHERFYLNLWLTLGCVTILSRWQEQLVAVTSILVISKVVAKFQPQLLWLVLIWAREFYELRVPFYVASISEMGSLCNYGLRWSVTNRMIAPWSCRGFDSQKFEEKMSFNFFWLEGSSKSFGNKEVICHKSNAG